MPKHSKRYNEARSNIERDTDYEPSEAIRLLRENSSAKFDETVELHLRMGVDPRHADQQIRGVVTLPHGTGRDIKIAVFANAEGQTLAKEAGADHVGGEELADEVQKGFTDFDIVLTTPDMMRVVGKLGRVLGPRGLMPSPKTGTIVNTEDLPKAIEESRLGRIEYRIDKTSNLHVAIGKASFQEEQLFDNLATIMEAVMAAKPASIKGIYLRRATLTSTMGPGIKIDSTAIGEMKAEPQAA